MGCSNHAGDDQARLWNGAAGRAWVDSGELLDQMFRPIQDLLVDAVSEQRPRRVLDVGCGNGGTTLAISRVLGAEGRCVGIDVSEPVIAAAQARARREGSTASYVCADAQTYEFEPASFDMLVSRFGVMFFGDFAAAFQNLRRSATGDAKARFVTWRSAEENPFMTAAERAAAPLLPGIPPRRADAPGQFGLADPLRTRRILEESGWVNVEVRPLDVTCTFLERDLVSYFTRLGPLGLVLHDAGERTVREVIDAVRPAFDPYVHGAEVRFEAACWMVSAARG